MRWGRRTCTSLLRRLSPSSSALSSMYSSSPFLHRYRLCSRYIYYNRWILPLVSFFNINFIYKTQDTVVNWDSIILLRRTLLMRSHISAPHFILSTQERLSTPLSLVRGPMRSCWCFLNFSISLSCCVHWSNVVRRKISKVLSLPPPLIRRCNGTTAGPGYLEVD